MESYIVRVYRRSGEAGREASGLVERVGNGGRQAFSSGEELWRIIAVAPGSASQSRRRKNKRAVGR